MARLLTYAPKNTWIHRLSGVTKMLFFCPLVHCGHADL